MKLSTKELLTPYKKGPKNKLNNIHKSKIINKNNTINKTNKNIISNEKQKLVFNTISYHENPFAKPIKIIKKNKDNKIPKLNRDNLQTNENIIENSVYLNAILKTETNSNKYEKGFTEKKNNENSIHENKNDFYNFYTKFKNSNLKRKIISGKRGNNNLSIPKKFIFQNDNKKKCKIIRNSIYLKGKKKYFSAKLLLTNTNITNKNVLNKLNKCINNTNKNLNTNHNNLKEKNIKEIKNILHQLKSTKEINPDLFEFNSGKNKNEEQRFSESNNSIFEDYSDKSFDSSFLGSSLNDKFYNDLIGKNI